MKPSLLVINGSLGGRTGNTAQAIRAVTPNLASKFKIKTLHLADPANLREPGSQKIVAALDSASAFLFTTGTYWDSWGSPMQIFLESTTKLEASAVWSGKPAAVLVTMHSVGGKEVLSRLQGVLSTLGLAIPPMTGMVYSMVNHQLAKLTKELQLKARSPRLGSEFKDDLWSLEDFETVAHNMHAYLEAWRSSKLPYEKWAVDRVNPARCWLK